MANSGITVNLKASQSKRQIKVSLGQLNHTVDSWSNLTEIQKNFLIEEHCNELHQMVLYWEVVDFTMNLTKDNLKKVTNLDSLLDLRYGVKGTKSRDCFDKSTTPKQIGSRLKELRVSANMTQQELCSDIGYETSFLSRIENNHVDIRLSTLTCILLGLGKSLSDI